MAIKRVTRKVKQFEYEGQSFGIRAPFTNEMKEITNKMAEYQRSIKREIQQDVADGIEKYTAPNGDLSMLQDVQVYIAENLCVDVNTGAAIFGNGPDQEDVNKTPIDFIQAAWFAYTGQSNKMVPFKAADIQDMLPLSFMREHATVSFDAVEEYIKSLEDDGKSEAAHKIRIALDIKKTEVAEVSPLTTAATTTSDSGGTSFSSQ